MEASYLIQCIIIGKQPNQLTNCDEKKKRALNIQTARAKEKPKLSNGDKHQALFF